MGNCWQVTGSHADVVCTCTCLCITGNGAQAQAQLQAFRSVADSGERSPQQQEGLLGENGADGRCQATWKRPAIETF